jgi:hypothetical protein
MATETSTGGASSGSDKKIKRSLGKGAAVDFQELEKRVHLAELRAREAEAELRYLVASAKRREMKSEKRDKGGKRKAGRKGSGGED